MINKNQSDLREECLKKQVFGTIEAIAFSTMQNPSNYQYVELYNMCKDMNLSINQMTIKFLYLDRPYLNYEFLATGKDKW